MIKAIVTGHSRGLGSAITNHLLTCGISVLGLSRSCQASPYARFGECFSEAALDLSRLDRILSWLEGDTLRAFLADAEHALLINNAGTVKPIGGLTMQDPQEIANAISLNVAAPLMLASAFASTSQNLPDRRILHISSGAARSPYPGWSIYCAGKAALDHHARAVSLDATPGLRICSLAPGIIDTDMQADIRASSLAQFPLRERFDALYESGGLADPDQTAQRVVSFMLSEQFGASPTADLRDLPA